MITITLNGQQCRVKPGTLLSLVDELGYSGKRIAVEVNLEIIPRSQWAQVMLHDGNRVEIVQAIGGG